LTSAGAAAQSFAMEHLGGCHCGNLRLKVRLAKPPADSPLRACGCPFCRAHNTRTVADPDGLAEISAGDWSLVELYRFGTRTADYVICRRCGVYLGAVCETAAGTRAVINVNSLDDRAAFTKAAVPNDYDGETVEQRLARRAVRWMPAAMRR
jgi:hypothetical protein